MKLLERWMLVGFAALAVAPGCARLNPAYFAGGESGASDQSGGSGSSSEGPPGGAEATTGEDAEGSEGASGGTEVSGVDTDPYEEPELICGGDRFDIVLDTLEPFSDCDEGGVGQAVAVSGCVAVEVVGGTLIAHPASGCDGSACEPALTDDAVSIYVEGLPLAELFQPSTQAPVCVTLDASGIANGRGDCWWDALVLWSNVGDLRLAVGSGIPDRGEVADLHQPGRGPVFMDSAVDAPATCGQDTGCPTSGWRAVTFGEVDVWADATGVPVESRLRGQELAVFNWGLNIDLACERHGRWGVVPLEDDWIFESSSP